MCNLLEPDNKKTEMDGPKTRNPGPIESIDPDIESEKKTHVKRIKRKSKYVWKNILAGGIAGGIEICITYPTEYTKTQLQLDEKANPRKYNGMIDCGKQTVQQHGFRGLYRGLPVLLLGSIPKAAVRFGAQQYASNKIQEGLFGATFATDNPVATSLLSGLFAGFSEAIFAVCPMETVKVRFIHDMNQAKPQYRGLVHGVSTIIKQEGLSGIYKGLNATLLKQGTNQMIRFGVMDSLKAYHKESGWGQMKWYHTAFYGGLAGAASVIGNTPIDVVKTRMQGLEASKYKSSVDCFTQIVKNEGPAALYKGTLPRMSRVVIDVALVFVIYEEVLTILDKVRPE